MLSTGCRRAVSEQSAVSSASAASEQKEEALGCRGRLWTSLPPLKVPEGYSPLWQDFGEVHKPLQETEIHANAFEMLLRATHSPTRHSKLPEAGKPIISSSHSSADMRAQHVQSLCRKRKLPSCTPLPPSPADKAMQTPRHIQIGACGLPNHRVAGKGHAPPIECNCQSCVGLQEAPRQLQAALAREKAMAEHVRAADKQSMAMIQQLISVHASLQEMTGLRDKMQAELAEVRQHMDLMRSRSPAGFSSSSSIPHRRQ